MFTTFPSYSRYRPLKLTDPLLRGEDVYSLQTALNALTEVVLTTDGILGQQTANAIVRLQKHLGIKADGVAGPGTQGEICRELTAGFSVPHELMFGQVSFECGRIIGNYSPVRPDGSYDAGIAQRNTAHTPARDGFNAPASVETLAASTRVHYDLFRGLSERRRWELAAGAWNAPAYACWIAREEGASGVSKARTAKPGPTARATLEAYIDSVTALF